MILYVHVGSEKKRIVMAPKIASALEVGDDVFIVPPGETFHVTSIVDTTNPRWSKLYVGTVTIPPPGEHA